LSFPKLRGIFAVPFYSRHEARLFYHGFRERAVFEVLDCYRCLPWFASASHAAGRGKSRGKPDLKKVPEELDRHETRLAAARDGADEWLPSHQLNRKRAL
jgi:hypothetical protein